MEQFRLRIGGQTLTLTQGEFDVGRMPDCWLTLDDDLVSRYHARFHVGENSLEIEDLGSRNGSYINGRRVIGRVQLNDADELRIGREVISVLGPRTREQEVLDSPTLHSQSDGRGSTQFPSLIGQLVDKSLSMGKVKEAERYALALTNQIAASRVSVDHPTAESCIRSLIALAEKSASGVWIDRVFRLHAVHGWIMSERVLERIRRTLDRIPRIPGTGLVDYEQALRSMGREGVEIPSTIMDTIAELSDSYRDG